nr:hypothetical protein Iba_chr06bCG12010 [Ipomoea batatas]
MSRTSKVTTTRRPLVTELFRGLGLEGKLRTEKVIAIMEPIIFEDLDQVKLKRGGDDVPWEDENEEEKGGKTVPQGMPNVNGWESMRTFQYHLHQEQMTLLRTHGDTLTQHGEEIAR